jgi:hypothetical protein
MDDLIKNGVKPNSKTLKKNTLVLPKGLSSILNSNSSVDFLNTPKSLLKSPRDETPIMINGAVVDLEKSIQERIDKVSSPSIKPISPPKFPNLGNFDPSISTPAVLPYNEVAIVESESENDAIPAPNINMDFSSLLLGAQHTPPKFVQEALNNMEILQELSKEDSPEKKIIQEESIRESAPKALPLPISLNSLLINKEERSNETPEIEKQLIVPSGESKQDSPIIPESNPSSPETVYKEKTPVPIFSFKARSVI